MAGDGRADKPEQHRSLPGRVIGAVVGSVVSPVVDAVDVDTVLEDVDINALLDRIDVNALLDRVEPNALLDRVDANRLLDRVDPDRLLDRVDANRLLDRVDPDRLLDRVDLDRVIARLDLDEVLARVDLDALVDRIDVARVIDRVDVDGLIGRVDVDALVDRIDVARVIDRVDVDGLIGRVDLNRVIERVDVDAVIDRVDVNGVIERVDVDAVLDRVDVNRLVERTELKAIIARSTTGVFTGVLDVVRTQLMVVDEMAQAVGAVLMRRPRWVAPGTPTDPDDRPDLRSLDRRRRAVVLQGHYAGSVSRFLAFLLDVFVIGLVFGLGALLVSSAVEVLFRTSLEAADHRFLLTVLYFGWAFCYLAGWWATAGRTVGMALLGVMVVRADGADLGAGRAAARAVCFPISFVLFGVGFVIGLFRRDRRELHDLLAGTCVISAWDAAEAQLRAEAVADAHPALASRPGPS